MRSTNFGGVLSMPGMGRPRSVRHFDAGGSTGTGSLYIDPNSGSDQSHSAPLSTLAESGGDNGMADIMSANDYGALNKAAASRATQNQILADQSYRKAQDAYANALNILQQGRASQGTNVPLLAFAQGMLGPTNNGSFAESLSRGIQGAIPAIEQQRQQDRDYASDVARLQSGQANLGMQYAQSQGKTFQDLVQERLSELGAQANQQQAAANLAETAAYHREMAPMYEAEADASRANAAATRAGMEDEPSYTLVGDANETDAKTGQKLGWFRNDNDPTSALTKMPYGNLDVTGGKAFSPGNPNSDFLRATDQLRKATDAAELDVRTWEKEQNSMGKQPTPAEVDAMRSQSRNAHQVKKYEDTVEYYRSRAQSPSAPSSPGQSTAPSQPAPSSPPPQKPVAGLPAGTTPDMAYAQAQQAFTEGRNPAHIAQRLRDMGLDPSKVPGLP